MAKDALKKLYVLNKALPPLTIRPDLVKSIVNPRIYIKLPNKGEK